MWKEIFSAVREPLIIFDAEGRPVRANPAAYAAFSLAETTLDPDSYQRVVNGLRLRSLDGTITPPREWPSARALRGEQVLGEAFAVTHPSGHDLVVEITAAPLFRHGAIIGAVTAWQDVTEQHRAEQALHDGEARYRHCSSTCSRGSGLAT